MVKILFLFFYVSGFTHNYSNNNVSLIKEVMIVIDTSGNKVDQDFSNTTIVKNKIGILSLENLKKLEIGLGSKDNTTYIKYIRTYIKETHHVELLDNSIFDSVRSGEDFKKLSDEFTPKFNLWFMSYFYVGLIGLFIALILNLKKSSDRIANLLISIFILLSSLFILHVCIFVTNVQFKFPHSLFITITFNLLYGPLLYFYFKRITSGYKFKTIDALHLTPFFLFLIYFMKYYVLSADEKLHILLNRVETFDPIIFYLVIIKVVSLLIYGYLIYRICMKSKKNKSSDKFEVIIKWEKNIMILNSVYVFSHILYVLMMVGFVSMSFLIHPQLISMSLIILFVGYTAYVQPIVFNRNYYSKGLLFLKYKKSGLTESLSYELKEQLLKLFYDEKIYKINDINLDTLSERLGTNRHSASQVINEHFNMNFFNLINKFRIQEALEIFKNDTNHNLNIIDVAYDVGYNNKVTFNKAFKEEMNITPSKFINDLNKNPFSTLEVNTK